MFIVGTPLIKYNFISLDCTLFHRILLKIFNNLKKPLGFFENSDLLTELSYEPLFLYFLSFFFNYTAYLSNKGSTHLQYKWSQVVSESKYNLMSPY